ncbi:MAG: carbon-nitrogen hydrolase family protein [Xylophilus ampelinus]
MRIAVLQMVSGPAVQDNLAQARGLIARAAAAGAELAVLPEYFCLLGQADTDKLAAAEPAGDGPVQRFLAEAARAHGLWIAGGTLPLAVPGDPHHVRNALLVFGPDGAQAARYDKIHLFRIDDGRQRFDESRTIAAGNAPASFVLPSRDGHAWRVGLSVCYDLRFPELYRRYADEGADLLLVPSAFTHSTGEAHWELLLRARAVENLAYVAAAAQGGLHPNGRRTWGHSLVADAWGGVLGCRAEDGPGLVCADLDAGRLALLRGQLPALGHRVL